MRKVLAVVAALAVAAGVVVFWQPINASGAPMIRPAHHPTARVCPDNGKLLVCFAIRQTDTVVPNLAANALPNGFGPADLRSAYGLTTTGSSAMTVAIVDAFDDPNAESDLATYRSTFSLPACTTANGCFRKINQSGQASPLPRTDTGWAGEISLDIDMVSAVCPDCHILLVEANSASTTNLGTAVNIAVNQGAKFVSNSYGGPENGSDLSYFNHPGVVITASTGDDGFGVSYPASGKGVTAVGGTSLTRDISIRGWSETVWNGAGSGCSGSVAKPAFQVGLTTGCAKRAEADVAAVADPQTGVAVYQTFPPGGWAVYGGTSAASPIIASVYALAGNPGTTDSPNSYPYAHPGALNDVISGNNGTCGAPLCTAGAGYDGPTGLGTPQGISAFASAAAVFVVNPGARTGTVGTPISLQVSASGGTAPYTWTASGLPAGLTINSASGLISGTPIAAGPFAVTVTAKDAVNTVGNTSFGWAVNTSSSTTLTSSTNPSTFGQPVTFTAAVSSAAGTPTGNVTFRSDANPLGTVTLVSGQATLTTSALPAGPHTITADYAGDANDAPSTATMAQTVNGAITTTALTASVNSSLPGQAVTFTAAVTSPAGTPTGTVTFASDGNPLGTVGLAGGQATLSTSALVTGNHMIVATYTPDPNFLTSTTTLAFTVGGVTYAVRGTGPSGGSSISRNLSVATLLKIYQCDSTLPPNTFEPLLPQFGSGTRKFFLENVLHVPGGDVANYTTTFPCVKQIDASNNPLLENTGNLLTNDRQLEPYAVSSYIAQTTNNVTDVHGFTLLGNIDGINSLTLNTSVAGSYPVFNVVPTSDIGSGTQTDQVFVGPNSQVCTSTDTIVRFGFGVDVNCGSTSIQTDP